MRRKVILLAIVFFLMGVTWGYAEKKTVRMTTYYPSPYGEYKNLKASNKVVVPVKDQDGNQDGTGTPKSVTNNEIWVEVEPQP